MQATLARGLRMGAVDQLSRQWQLLTILGSAANGVTLRSLADQTHVCDRTIRRDLAFMQTVGIPLVETKGDFGRKYWSLQDADKLLKLCFTLEEAAALYLGRQFLEPLAGTYFHHEARSAFEKIKSSVGIAALRHLEKLAASFYHKTHGLTDYSHQDELIDDLHRAIEDRLLTVISYQSLRSTEPVTHYDIHPLSLTFHNHALYLLAYSCDHGSVRVFKVNRISEVETQRLSFTPPAKFDAAEFLAGSFGIFQGDGPRETVRVRFSATVARFLQEKQFHTSQDLSTEPSGSILATYSLSSFEEFTSWLLSFGPHAEVLEPEALREKVIGSLAESLENYKLQEDTKTLARALARRTPK